MMHFKYPLACLHAIFLLVALSNRTLAEKPKQATTPEQAVEFLAAASKAGDLQGTLDQIAPPFRDMMLLFILQEEADDAVTDALNKTFGNQPRRGFRMEVKQDLLRIRKIQIMSKEVMNENRVKLTVRETVKSFRDEEDGIGEMEYLAVKVGNQWKLFRPFTALVFGASDEETRKVIETGPDGKEIKIFKIQFKDELDQKAREFVTRFEAESKGQTLSQKLSELREVKTLAEKIADDINNNKFKSREEADKAYQNARKQVESD